MRYEVLAKRVKQPVALKMRVTSPSGHVQEMWVDVGRLPRRLTAGDTGTILKGRGDRDHHIPDAIDIEWEAVS